jgi:hypothetical protein
LQDFSYTLLWQFAIARRLIIDCPYCKLPMALPDQTNGVAIFIGDLCGSSHLCVTPLVLIVRWPEEEFSQRREDPQRSPGFLDLRVLVNLFANRSGDYIDLSRAGKAQGFRDPPQEICPRVKPFSAIGH